MHTVALLTDMSTPLGLTAGNALEVRESVEVLAGGGPADVVELTVALAREMLAGAGREDVDPADVLASGGAMDAWKQMIAAQGGDPDAELPVARETHVVTAPSTGVLTRLDAMAVGLAAWRLGAGRAKQGDAVQAGAGVEWHARPGDPVTEGQPLLTLHTDEPDRFERALASLEGGYDVRRRVVVRADADRARPDQPRPDQLSSRTTVSATQAGLSWSSISMTYFMVSCLPAGMSVTSPTVTVARTRAPTGTGLGKRTLLTP